MKYTITLDSKQLNIISRAIDFYERVIGLGQLEEISWMWRNNNNPRDENYESNYFIINSALNIIKKAGWGHDPNESHSIYSNNVPEEFKILYDITQKIRKCVNDVEISKAKEEGDFERVRHLEMTVNNRSFMAASDNEPIEIFKNPDLTTT
jgi:uncharacterized glyoxalase superfamily protein PhnB